MEIALTHIAAAILGGVVVYLWMAASALVDASDDEVSHLGEGE